MKKLSQLGLQLLEIWKQLGLNQRISVGLTAVLVMGGLLSLAFWSNRPDMALLYGGLDPAEASKVVTALDEAKVIYKVQGAGTIFVPSDKVYSTRIQLAGKGLPAKGDGVGFEIFDKSNFGISDFVQRINYLRALQGELARTIAQMDEIEAARVTLTVPENPLLGNNQRKPSASVFVKIRGRMELSSMTINSIRFLVANSVEALQPNHVAVVDNRGNVLSSNSEEDSIVGLTSSQLSVRQNLEKYLSKQAEGALNFFLGPNQAIVRVAAEINYDTINRTEIKVDPDGAVPKSITIKDDKTVSSTSAGGGVAGLIPNTNADTNNTTAGPVNNSNNNTKMTTTENEISKSTSTILQVPGTIKRLTAAVVIAGVMKGTGADRKMVPRTEDDLKKIQKLVENAIGAQLAPDSGRTDELTLMEMELNDQGGLEITKELDKQHKQEFWIGLVKNLVFPALAFAVLYGFYRSFKSTPVENIPIGIPLGQFAAHGLTPLGGGGNGNGNGNGHTEEPGVVTVDVLNRLVRENPDNMSQAIREWLSRTKPSQKN